jgi:hypothetical protein
MKTNEEIIKELYCNVLLKSMNGSSIIERAIKDAELAIIAFNNQFTPVDILKQIDSSIIKIWNNDEGTLQIETNNFRIIKKEQ